LVSKGDSQDEEAPTTVGDLMLSSVKRRAKPFMLDQVRGPGSPRDWLLELDEVVVGRSMQAHICIESTLLSRRHMALQRVAGEYRLVDLGSANGVYLNGVKAHSAVLREGDLLQMGDVVFVFHEGS
jgi:pSer/pThr/pTyr-binding forkhead associated (FHA) protein